MLLRYKRTKFFAAIATLLAVIKAENVVLPDEQNVETNADSFPYNYVRNPADKSIDEAKELGCHDFIRVEAAGLYKLVGDVYETVHGRIVKRELWECRKQILAPYNTKVQVTLQYLNARCDPKNEITLFDGWETPGLGILPPKMIRDGPRAADICDYALLNTPVTYSQNIGEIIYKLRRNEIAVIRVEFVPESEPCNVFINANQLEESEFEISSSKAGNCPWYFLGPVEVIPIKMDLQNADAKTCDFPPSNRFDVFGSMESWDSVEMKTIFSTCSAEVTNDKSLTINERTFEAAAKRLPMRCQRIVANLHNTIDGVRQSIRIRVRPLSQKDRRPWKSC